MMKKTKKLALSLLAGFTAISLFIACDKDDDNPAPSGPQKDIVELAISAGYDSLAVALTEAGLVSTFQGDNSGPFTVFAPTNAAFAALINSNGSWDQISDIDPLLLDAVLKYHVLDGKVKSSDIVDGRFFETLSGLTFKINTGTLTIDINASTKTGINITAIDIKATNGVIHEIDEVLIPDLPSPTPTQSLVDVATSNGFDSLAVALTEAGLLSTFDGSSSSYFTVFAPTNTAFQNLINGNGSWNEVADIPAATLLAVLQFHVSSGVIQSGQLANGQLISTLQGTNLAFSTAGGLNLSGGSSADVSITSTDVYATNGVIHVIDEVLLP